MAIVSPKQFQTKTGGHGFVRSAITGDAIALTEHWKNAKHESSHLITEPDEVELNEDHERAWIDAHTTTPTSLLLIAEVGGEMGGVLNFACGDRRRLAHRGSLGLTVRKSHRSNGIGSVLLDTLIEWGEEHPIVEKITLAVVVTNTSAIKLYEKYGFVEEGRRPREVKLGPEEYVDDVLMYRFVD